MLLMGPKCWKFSGVYSRVRTPSVRESFLDFPLSWDVLQPHGFFNCSPAIDVPPAAEEKTQMETGNGAANTELPRALMSKL